MNKKIPLILLGLTATNLAVAAEPFFRVTCDEVKPHHWGIHKKESKPLFDAEIPLGKLQVGSKFTSGKFTYFIETTQPGYTGKNMVATEGVKTTYVEEEHKSEDSQLKGKSKVEIVTREVNTVEYGYTIIPEEEKPAQQQDQCGSSQQSQEQGQCQAQSSQTQAQDQLASQMQNVSIGQQGQIQTPAQGQSQAQSQDQSQAQTQAQSQSQSQSSSSSSQFDAPPAPAVGTLSIWKSSHSGNSRTVTVPMNDSGETHAVMEYRPHAHGMLGHHIDVACTVTPLGLR